MLTGELGTAIGLWVVVQDGEACWRGSARLETHEAVETERGVGGLMGALSRSFSVNF